MQFALPQPLDFLHRVKPQAAPMHVSSPPCYFSMAGTQSLRGLLTQPNRHFLEIGPRALLEDTLYHINRAAPDFALSISNTSAFSGGLAEILAIALEDRFNLPALKRAAVMTCLHEALANATIHGNLGLGNPDDSPTGFDEYYAYIRLISEHEPYRDRRVGVYAWHRDGQLKLSVSDQGEGFPDAGVLERVPCDRGHYGRGLFLIRSLADSVWIEQDNRTLSMTFS